jgi:hypothetical protein
VTVEELLTSRGIYFMPKGADLLVSCLSPDHEDRNPSMRIDRITGIFQCFSCGFKGNIFTHFGEKANQLQLRRASIYSKKVLNFFRKASVVEAITNQCHWQCGGTRPTLLQRSVALF